MLAGTSTRQSSEKVAQEEGERFGHWLTVLGSTCRPAESSNPCFDSVLCTLDRKLTVDTCYASVNDQTPCILFYVTSQERDTAQKWSCLLNLKNSISVATFSQFQSILCQAAQSIQVLGAKQTQQSEDIKAYVFARQHAEWFWSLELSRVHVNVGYRLLLVYSWYYQLGSSTRVWCKQIIVSPLLLSVDCAVWMSLVFSTDTFERAHHVIAWHAFCHP